MDTAGYNLQFKNMQIRHNIFKEYQIKFICYMFANKLQIVSFKFVDKASLKHIISFF